MTLFFIRRPLWTPFTSHLDHMTWKPIKIQSTICSVKSEYVISHRKHKSTLNKCQKMHSGYCMHCKSFIKLANFFSSWALWALYKIYNSRNNETIYSVPKIIRSTAKSKYFTKHKYKSKFNSVVYSVPKINLTLQKVSIWT